MRRTLRIALPAVALPVVAVTVAYHAAPRAVFPTLDETVAHSTAVQEGWDTVVGAEIAAE